MSNAVLRSTAIRPPTHFLTLHQTVDLSDTAFSKALGQFFAALKRRLEGLEYLWMNEWSEEVRHAHALLIVPAGISGRAVRRMVKQAEEVSGGLLRVTCEKVHDPVAVVRYIFKDTHKKAELPPPGFKGKLYMTSRGFLVRPMRVLRREFRDSAPKKNRLIDTIEDSDR